MSPVAKQYFTHQWSQRWCNLNYLIAVFRLVSGFCLFIPVLLCIWQTPKICFRKLTLSQLGVLVCRSICDVKACVEMFALTLSICCVWITQSIRSAISKGGNVSCSCPKFLKQQLQPGICQIHIELLSVLHVFAYAKLCVGQLGSWYTVLFDFHSHAWFILIDT